MFGVGEEVVGALLGAFVGGVVPFAAVDAGGDVGGELGGVPMFLSSFETAAVSLCSRDVGVSQGG